MEDIYTWNVRNVYNYTISSIGKFNKKEDFEIFYYFKDFDFLHEGYNNVFLEILVWLSDHEEKIENLINETNNNLIQNDKNIWLNSSFIMAGTKGEGKSIVLSQLLLQKDTVILEKKEFSLEQFKDEDKNYFYLLLINLTKEKNLNNFALQIQKNKKNLILKGVSKYIEKKLNYDCLYKKLENNKKEENITKKKLKI